MRTRLRMPLGQAFGSLTVCASGRGDATGKLQSIALEPLQSDQPLVDLQPVRFGCTGLRVTELPTLDEA